MNPLESSLMLIAPQTRYAVANGAPETTTTPSDFGQIWSQLANSDGEEATDHKPDVEVVSLDDEPLIDELLAEDSPDLSNFLANPEPQMQTLRTAPIESGPDGTFVDVMKHVTTPHEVSTREPAARHPERADSQQVQLPNQMVSPTRPDASPISGGSARLPLSGASLPMAQTSSAALASQSILSRTEGQGQSSVSLPLAKAQRLDAVATIQPTAPDARGPSHSEKVVPPTVFAPVGQTPSSDQIAVPRPTLQSGSAPLLGQQPTAQPTHSGGLGFSAPTSGNEQAETGSRGAALRSETANEQHIVRLPAEAGSSNPRAPQSAPSPIALSDAAGPAPKQTQTPSQTGDAAPTSGPTPITRAPRAASDAYAPASMLAQPTITPGSSAPPTQTLQVAAVAGTVGTFKQASDAATKPIGKVLASAAPYTSSASNAPQSGWPAPQSAPTPAAAPVAPNAELGLFGPGSGVSSLDAPIEGNSLTWSPTGVTATPTGAAPTSPTAPQANPAAVAQQIATSFANSSGKTTEIALNPEELGRVRISLTTTEAGMSVSIISERPETTDLMRRHIDALAREFAELGYDNLAFSFDNPSEGADQNGSGDETATAQSDQDFPAVETHILPALSVTPTGGLDLKL